MNSWLLFSFIGTFGWGISLFLIKILLGCMTPIEIVLYRMAIGSILLFVLVKAMRIHVDNFKFLLRDGIIIGIFNITVPYYLTSLAEKSVATSLASVINGLTPIFVFMLSYFFAADKKKINYVNITSLLLGLIGIIVIHFDDTLDQYSKTGISILLLASFSYGIAALYMHRWIKTREPLLVALTAAIVSITLLIPCKMITSHTWHFPHHLEQLFALTWLGAIGSGLSLYLYCSLIHQAGPILASMVTYLMGLTGVLMGIVFLHEHFSMTIIIGCSCILLSLMLMNHQQFFLKLLPWWIINRKKIRPFILDNSRKKS